MYAGQTYDGETYDGEIGNCNRLSLGAKKKMTCSFAINAAIAAEPFSCQGIAGRWLITSKRHRET